MSQALNARSLVLCLVNRRNNPIVTAAPVVDVEVRSCEAHACRGSHGAGKPAIVPAGEVELLCLLAQPIQMFRAEAVCSDVSGQAAAVETDMLGGIGAGDRQRSAEAVLKPLPQLRKPIAEVLAGEVFGFNVDERLCAACLMVLILQLNWKGQN